MYVPTPLLDKLPLVPMLVWDHQENKLLALTSKLEEFLVQFANKKGHPKPTNQLVVVN
jgi:hypothetical protein